MEFHLFPLRIVLFQTISSIIILKRVCVYIYTL